MDSPLYQSFLFKQTIKFFILIQLLMNNQGLVCGQSRLQKRTFTVVLDPGHGGKDPGTVWKKVYEKDIALAIALKLGNIIKKNMSDAKVLYTRQTDVFIDLDKRAPVANKNQADLFISIHVNSNEKSLKADGTETFFMGTTKSEENLEVAIKENAVITKEDNYILKYEGYDPNSPNSFIALSLVQSTHWKQSLSFASCVQNQFVTSKRTDRGVKQAGFLVLWRTAVPSVLVETGFITNENDRKLLTSEHGQELIATSIYRAIKNYKEGIESGSVAVTTGRHVKDSVPVPLQKTDSAVVITDTTNDKTDTPDNTDKSKVLIEFLVQVSSSKKPLSLNPKHFKGLKNVEELKTGDKFKYAVGRKSSYNEVVEYAKIVRNYFPDAFIIAVKDGKIIPLKEALKEIKD
jgi:N-acetylmuramoyl-L-alanine amidase